MKITQSKFLSNGPVGEDLFEGKSQEKIADTLCDILKRKDFQIIGIDGGWGTGKSNLVSIIEKKLKSLKYHFFIYDVWGHQEDEQRRAILEELTEFIAKEDRNIVVDKSKWKENLSDLLSKSKTTRIITQPVLSIGIVLSVLAIVLTPLFNTISVYITAEWLKTLIVSIPFLGLLIAFGVFYKKEKNAKQALMKLFEIYEKEKFDTTTYEKVSEQEPSVKKFRYWMSEIDKDLGNSKLVLVFDNFDRLPKDDILSLWSSIHVFFAEMKYENIKVIIPFDRQHIKNAFKELDNDREESNSEVALRGNYSEDYINKTFDIIYRVSPPILSNWKNYFKDKWFEAFGEADNEEYERIVQLYEIFNETITPREVIVFINEIVSLKLLFNGTIPEQYFALFILNKDKILSNPLKEISEPSYLAGSSYLYKNDESLPKYMTAIVYQIDPDNAIEVVYAKQLKNSLVNKEIDTFKTISNSPFFHSTIYKVLKEIENIEYPIETLDTLNSESRLSSYTLKLIWKRLYDKALEYRFEEFELKGYQKILLKNIELDIARDWLIFILNDLYNKAKFNAERFAKIIDELNFCLKEYSIDINVFELLRQKEVIIELFVPFISQKLEKFGEYKISCNEGDLNSYLKGIDIERLANINYIKALNENYSLKEFIESLELKIEQNKTDRQKLIILFSKLKEVKEKPFNQYLSDADIYTLFNQSSENEDFYFDLAAMRLSRLNNYSTSYASTFTPLLRLEDEIKANKVAERIEFYIKYDDFLIGSDYFTDSPLYKMVVKKIIINNNGSLKVNLRLLLQKFEEICNNTGVDAEMFLASLNAWKYHEKNENDALEFPNLLYRTSVVSETELGKDLVINANAYFSALYKDKWIDIFDNLTSKLFELIQIISFDKWNSHSTDALLESLEKVVSGGKPLLKDKWNYVIESYDRAGIPLTNVFKGIRDKFYSDRGLINKEFFTFFINHFQEKNVLDDKTGDAFRTFFKVEFLEDAELVHLMIDKADYINHLISKSHKHEVSDFVQGIKDRCENSDLVKQLAQRLKIEVSSASKS